MDKWIVCLKHGDKYSSVYVNRLYNMTKRHSKANFKFACLTENSSGLNPNIIVIPLPSVDLVGWWYKVWIFDSDFPLKGQLLYMDLDIVIINNFDHMWDFEPDKFSIIRDFNRKFISNYEKFNSSIFKLKTGSFPHVWNNLKVNPDMMRRLHGDQDWIFKQIKSNFTFWPEDWIQSYKWEIRSKNDLIAENGKRKFKNIAAPFIKNDTSFLVFHGDPKPEDVKDPIIVDNWQ